MKKFLLLMIAISFVACSKKHNCENGQICVVNETGETVHYSWGSNFYEDSVAPGEKACRYVGEISRTLFSQSSSTVTFDSDHGAYSIHVTSCYQEHILK